MKSNETKPSSDRLRELLRRGDPAADGRAPDADETRLLRARVLEEARSAGGGAPAPRGLFRPAVAFAWAAAACVAVLVAVGTVSLRRGPARPEQADRSSPGVEAAAPRQVQFTTPGGTRIVWVLYPETP